MPGIPGVKSKKTLDFIHWVNKQTEFTFKGASSEFKEWNPGTIGSVLSTLRKSGYLNKGERRGEYVVLQHCPDNADLSMGKNQFNQMF